MIRHPARLIAATLALALAGCGSHNDKTPQDAAGGEVLPGTVNDNMLPYDTVRSQPPPAAPSDDAADGDSKSAASDAQAGDEKQDAEASDAPAQAAPKPQASPAN